MDTTQEPSSIVDFRKWTQANGAYIHPAVVFGMGEHGLSVFASSTIESNSKIVSCPFDLIITPSTARTALETICNRSCSLSNQEALGTYLTLHLGSNKTKFQQSQGDACVFKALRHQPYIEVLPRNLSTPLFFTSSEMGLLRGTNLYHAVDDQRKQWLTAWQTARDWLQLTIKLGEGDFVWDDFLRALSWITSRAFPSTLMNTPPSLTGPDATPVMVPLLDIPNHARRTPVSWSIDEKGQGDTGPSMGTCLTLVSGQTIERYDEVVNNYGSKPNDSLLLGYGFTLLDNPEDYLLLKLPGSERRFRILRGASGEVEGVWNEVGRRLQEGFASDESDLDILFTELQLEIGQVLPEMLNALRDKLPQEQPSDQSNPPLPDVRSEVRATVHKYVKGQREILDDLLAYCARRFEEAMEQAQELGIDVMPESGEDEE